MRLAARVRVDYDLGKLTDSPTLPHLQPSVPPASDPLTGLVLSGGGTRGAYEVGVLLGILEALSPTGRAHNPFDLVAGASVGAINSAYVTANADAPGLNLGRLIDAWMSMDFAHVFGPQLLFFLRQLVRGTAAPRARDTHLGRSLLDPAHLERLVGGAVDFDSLHQNLREGVVRGLFIAALQVVSGRTVLFCELAPGASYSPSKDPRRHALVGPLTLEHVLASAAIPLVFPARRVGEHFYCDGGLRLNTPIAPVIRAGASRLVIISTTYRPGQAQPGALPPGLSSYPSLTFLVGKVLNALLLDPLVYDLLVLERINDIVDVHRRGLSDAARADLDRRMELRRGVPYRHLDALVFGPSQNIAGIAAAYLKDNLKRLDVGLVGRRLLRTASEEGSADWATYLIFDGGFAERLIELGHHDALARREEVRSFFGA